VEIQILKGGGHNMPYFLGCFILDDKNRVEITENVYSQIKTHKRNLIHSLDIEERFDLFLANYMEFESELLSMSLRHNIYLPKWGYREFAEERVLLNRRISNLLSSCKLYLDQLEHSLKGIWGEGPEFKKKEELIHREYDKNFSYRLMEALRNYAQHRGLVANSLSLKMESPGIGLEGETACTISPQLMTKELASDKKVKAEVREELKHLPERINLKPHIRLYMDSLCLIHMEIRNLLSSYTNIWESTIMGAVDNYKIKAGITSVEVPSGLCIFQAENFTDDVALEQDAVFYDFINHRKFLENKNNITPNLSRRFSKD
jgi:hypothetical protein